MGSSARAIIIYGFHLDTDAVDESELSEDWRERRYAALWASLGLDPAKLETPDDRAGYGSESEHFVYQVATARGLEAQHVWSWDSDEYVIGKPLKRAGKAEAVNLSKLDRAWKLGGANHLVDRVAKVFGVKKMGVYLVPFYG